MWRGYKSAYENFRFWIFFLSCQMHLTWYEAWYWARFLYFQKSIGTKDNCTQSTAGLDELFSVDCISAKIRSENRPQFRKLYTRWNGARQMQNNNPQTLEKRPIITVFLFLLSSACSFCSSLSLRQGRKTIQETLYCPFWTKNTSTFHLQGD